MIHVTRLQGEAIVLNADQILYIERTPDTLLTLANGTRLMIQESPELVIERVVAYRRAISSPGVRECEDVGDEQDAAPTPQASKRADTFGRLGGVTPGKEA